MIQVERVYEGHEGDVTHLLPFVAHILTLDSKNVFRVFDIKSAGKMRKILFYFKR